MIDIRSSVARCVFINCPFDKTYEPALQAILVAIVTIGFQPRLATESSDSGSIRLQKIQTLIEGSKFSIHDLSRCQAKESGEHFRFNRPFELGLDYGCRQYFGEGRSAKKILILEEQPYRYQAALSDLAGCDIQAHKGDFQVAIRKVRNWLVNEAGANADGAARISDAYADFQEWYYEKQLSKGFSDADIQDYPTFELMNAMIEWVALGKPL